MNSNDPNFDDLLPPSGGTGPAGFDFRAFFESLRRSWRVVVVTALLGLAFGFFFIQTHETIYRAEAEINAESRSATGGVSVTGEYLSKNATLPHEELKTVEKTFLSGELARRVSAKLDLAKRPGFFTPGANSDGATDPAGSLLAHAQVALVPETRLIKIAFNHHVPEIALDVANALAEEGIAMDNERRAARIQASVDYLKEEAEKINAKLTQTRKQLNDYTRSLGSVSIDQELNIVADKLKDLNLRATHARAERVKIEGGYFEVERCKGDPEQLASLDIILRAPGIANLAGRINDLRGNLAKLTQRYRAGHPFVVQASTELKELEATFRERVKEAAQGVEAALAAAKHSEEMLLKETEEQEKKVFHIRDLAVHAEMLRGQIQVDELSYQATLKRLNEELSQTRSQPEVLHLTALASWAYPVSLPPSRILGSALAAGILVGLGLIALRVQLDSTVKSPERVERDFALPVLAPVPEYIEGPKNGARRTGFATLDAPYSGTAEVFRTLRTALDPGLRGENGKFILFTGADSGVGTSFCTLNLSVALAQSGLRTLLIDANLRTPVVEDRVFSSRGRYGLSDFLQGRAALSSVILASGIPNLDVITAGSPSMHPVELLSRSRFRVMMEGAEPLYDRIVVDAAPVSPVSDTFCVARFFPNLCLVLRAGKTTKASVSRALDLLARSGAKVSGLVLNYTEKSRSEELLPSLAIEGDSPDFPRNCPHCQRLYPTMEEFLAQTSPPEKPANALPESDPEFQSEPQFLRRCACGAVIDLPPVKRRDTSAEGLQRRELFSELQHYLQATGWSQEEARTQLLLTLKTWRNEISGQHAGEESSASVRRRQLFDDLLQRLEQAGLPRQEAEVKLLTIIRAWRQAP